MSVLFITWWSIRLNKVQKKSNCIRYSFSFTDILAKIHKKRITLCTFCINLKLKHAHCSFLGSNPFLLGNEKMMSIDIPILTSTSKGQ